MMATRGSNTLNAYGASALGTTMGERERYTNNRIERRTDAGENCAKIADESEREMDIAHTYSKTWSGSSWSEPRPHDSCNLHRCRAESDISCT